MLLIDFSKYFDNIVHAELLRMFEARLQNDPDPYDFAELAAARQKVRDDINALQAQIKKLA